MHESLGSVPPFWKTTGGSKPVEGVGVSTTAFIGYARSGDFNSPTLIRDWIEFQQIFGEEENAFAHGLSQELLMSPAAIHAAKRATGKKWADFAQARIELAILARKTTVPSFAAFMEKHNIGSGSPFLAGSYLAHAVQGFFENGGREACIVRIAGKEDVEALQRSAPVEPRHAVLSVGPLQIRPLKTGSHETSLTVEVKHVGAEGFLLSISDGDEREAIGSLEKPLTLSNAATTTKNSKLANIELNKEAHRTRPEARSYTLAGSVSLGGTLSSSSSNLALTLTPDEFEGNEMDRTGVSGLVSWPDVSIVCAPDIMAGVWALDSLSGEESPFYSEAMSRRILKNQRALVEFCERMGDRMAILDPLPGLRPQEMKELAAMNPFRAERGQAALYYPWVKVADPCQPGKTLFIPPCGHAAGVWARTACLRGVHHAPANERLIGVLGLEFDLSKREGESLSQSGVNYLRIASGEGALILGAKTLFAGSNSPSNRIETRRLLNYLESSLESSLQWVIFEPNDDDLRGRVQRNITAFLHSEWQSGRLAGATPQEAFYVKCDSAINPPETAEQGRLYVEVGISANKPSQFAVFRLGQWAEGSSLTEA